MKLEQRSAPIQRRRGTCRRVLGVTAGGVFNARSGLASGAARVGAKRLRQQKSVREARARHRSRCPTRRRSANVRGNRDRRDNA